jgi:hypothetical protein
MSEANTVTPGTSQDRAEVPAEAPACDVCLGTSTCTWCCGEGYDLAQPVGTHPCDLCAGSGACSFCAAPNGTSAPAAR